MKGESRASRLFGFRSVHDIGGDKFYTDIINRALLLVSERQSSVAAIGNDGWCQRSMISVVTFV